MRWAALGCGCTLVLIAGLAVRWRLFLRQQQISLPFSTIFSLTWAGQFFNSILPGSTGGDVVKIYQVCRLAPDRKAAAASTVLVDRLSALLALLALAGTALLLDPKPLLLLPLPDFPGKTIVLGAVVIACGGLVGGFLGVRMLRRTQLHGRVVRTLAATRNALAWNGRLLIAVVLAFAIHLLNFLIIYFFARADGISITFPQVALMMPVILFLVMVPVTINGHGLRELLLIAYFGYLGVTVTGHAAVDVRETAIALSLIAVANDLLWSVPGGIWYSLSFGKAPAE